MSKKYFKNKKSGIELYRNKAIIEKPTKDIIYLKQTLISFGKKINFFNSKLRRYKVLEDLKRLINYFTIQQNQHNRKSRSQV